MELLTHSRSKGIYRVRESIIPVVNCVPPSVFEPTIPITYFLDMSSVAIDTSRTRTCCAVHIAHELERVPRLRLRFSSHRSELMRLTRQAAVPGTETFRVAQVKRLHRCCCDGDAPVYEVMLFELGAGALGGVGEAGHCFAYTGQSVEPNA